MTYALLGSGLGALAAVMTLALLLYKAQRETMAVKDLYDSLDKQSDELLHQRDTFKAQLDVKSAELTEAKQRLASAEAQRNDAERREAARLKESDVHTVADVLVSTVGGDWRSVHGVSPLPNAGNPRPGDTDLEKP